MTARYQPGTAHLAVGGDWYDTLALPSGRIALTIGDVAGHGVDAAAAMGRIRSAIQAFSQAIPAPGTLLTQLDVFASRFSELDYLTLCHAVLDPATGAIDYASAGHPPMLVLDPQGAPSFLEEGRSPPLPDPGAAPDRPRRAARPARGSSSTRTASSSAAASRPTSASSASPTGPASFASAPCDEFADELIRRMGRRAATTPTTSPSSSSTSTAVRGGAE